MLWAHSGGEGRRPSENRARVAGQLRRVGPSRAVGVRVGVEVSSHGAGTGQSHKCQEPHVDGGGQRNRGLWGGEGGGAEAWARWGEVPATVLASGGRGMRRRHLQAASLAKVGLGAGGQV